MTEHRPKTRQGEHTLPELIGQIEGHQIPPEDVKTTKYEHVLPMLAAIEESPEITGLLILLNTVGGDVEAGLAIAELIAGMSKPTVSLVLGGGHSIGVPLAVAAKRSFIAPTASMTIHPVRINGLVIGAPQTYEYLAGGCRAHSELCHGALPDKPQGLYAPDVRTRASLQTTSGLSSSGEEAVQCGLIDQIGTLSDALEYLKITADAE